MQWGSSYSEPKPIRVNSDIWQRPSDDVISLKRALKVCKSQMYDVEIYFPCRSGKHSVYLTACESLTESSCPPPHFPSAKTQFAINWKKFTGFWANSTSKLLGSNISQYARGMSLLKLSLLSRLISCCFTVPKWMIQFTTNLRKEREAA